MTDLRTAAQALVDRWDTPLWKDAEHTGKYIDALRQALAASPAMTEAEERAAFEAEHKNWSLVKTYSLYGLISYSEPLLEERWLAWQARAALSAPPVPAEPDGFKLVPIDPTPEMVSAYLDRNDAYWHDCDALPPPPGTWRTGTPSEATAVSYRAMLAAAPSPQEQT